MEEVLKRNRVEGGAMDLNTEGTWLAGIEVALYTHDVTETPRTGRGGDLDEKWVRRTTLHPRTQPRSPPTLPPKRDLELCGNHSPE